MGITNAVSKTKTQRKLFWAPILAVCLVLVWSVPLANQISSEFGEGAMYLEGLLRYSGPGLALVFITLSSFEYYERKYFFHFLTLFWLIVVLPLIILPLDAAGFFPNSRIYFFAVLFTFSLLPAIVLTL